MDRFTQNRLRDEAIQHAGDRASLRKPAHPMVRSPSRSVPSTDGELGEQSKPSVMARGSSDHADREGRMECRT
jgi:hypothetical protein